MGSSADSFLKKVQAIEVSAQKKRARSCDQAPPAPDWPYYLLAPVRKKGIESLYSPYKTYSHIPY